MFMAVRFLWSQIIQPLETILRKPLHEAPRRLQRMMMELQRYDLTVKYLKGENMYLADTLSRAFLPIIESDYDNDERVCAFTSQKDFENVHVDGTEIAISDQRLSQIAQHTRNDTFMGQTEDNHSRRMADQP